MAQRRSLNQTEPAIQWYRQFWPWFLLALPGCVIVASLVTVAISFIHSDNLVNDSYYRKGLAINQQLALDQAASKFEVKATLVIQAEQMIKLSVNSRIPPSELPSSVHVLWQHPTASSKDFRSTLNRQGKYTYAAQLQYYPAGRWYITLKTDEKPARGPAWRLKEEIVLRPLSKDKDTVTNPGHMSGDQTFELAAPCAQHTFMGCVHE